MNNNDRKIYKSHTTKKCLTEELELTQMLLEEESGRHFDFKPYSSHVT